MFLVAFFLILVYHSHIASSPGPRQKGGPPMKESLTINLYKQPPSKINLVTRHLAVPVQLHMHNFYELELIISGTGTNRINGIPFPIRPGLMYLLTPNDTHQIDVEGQVTVIHIGFLPDQPGGFTLPLPSGGVALQLKPEELAQVKSLFHTVEKECASLDAYRFHGAWAALTLILIKLLRDGQVCASASSFQKLQPALLYIWEHCSEEGLDLQQVAAYCSLSPSYFSSLFHKTFGSSFSEYLAECRLRCACYLLSETDISITDVVYESGFSSPSRFFRVFKARFHVTPSQYRKDHGEIASIAIEEQVPISIWQSGQSYVSSQVDAVQAETGK